MSKEIVLNAKKREKTTKGALNLIRKGGLVPCVLYGAGDKTVELTINAKELFLGLHSEMGEHALFQLNVDGKKKIALVKEKQINPVTRNIIHVDFQHISLKDEVEVEIPFEIIGKAPGVALGGILELPLHEIKIKCIAADIPKNIQVDVSKLEIGNSIHIKDLVKDGKYKLLADPDQVVVTVTAPVRVEETPVAAAEVADADKQPEVITKGKKDEEGEVKK
ncbi:MAG: 50S ribosomal protein L25 [Elusimicrobiota bacterium]